MLLCSPKRWAVGLMILPRNHPLCQLGCMTMGLHPDCERCFPVCVTALTPMMSRDSWPAWLLTPDTPALQTADFHEALCPTVLQLHLLDSAFHLLRGFSQEGIAASGQHAMRKAIPSGAALFLLLIFKCSCFKSSFPSPPWHAGSFSIYTIYDRNW